MSLADLLPLRVCCAMPSDGGDWALILWIAGTRRSWWVA